MHPFTFNDIFLAPPLLDSMSNNQYGTFVQISHDTIKLIKNQLYHAVIRKWGSSGRIHFVSPIRIIDCRINWLRPNGHAAPSCDLDSFIYNNSDTWILHTSRNNKDSEYFGTIELKTHQRLHAAEDMRRVARLRLYKIMIQWTYDKLSTLARNAGLSDPIARITSSMKHPEAFESAMRTYPNMYTLPAVYVDHIVAFITNNDGQTKLKNHDLTAAGYAFSRAMFKLMRARLIVLLRRLTRQKDTARMIVCMVYKWRCSNLYQLESNCNAI